MPFSSIADSMTPLPEGCLVLDDRYPWTTPLPNTQWVALQFERAHLSKGDFAAHGIEAPFSIRQAAPKRRAEFLAGRLCAREASKRLMGSPTIPGIDENKAPLWPQGLVGSITHSGTLAAAIVASAHHYQSIGLDAEAMMNIQRAERLAPRILTPVERDWLDALPLERRGAFVTQVFSLKESLFKALFPLVGVRFYFQDAELAQWEPESSQVSLRLLKNLSLAWPAGSRVQGQYTLLDSHLLSVIAL
nr:4'-phosphopantetheinyl transferase superfamily protein [uncultured Halomonas sp.]